MPGEEGTTTATATGTDGKPPETKPDEAKPEHMIPKARLDEEIGKRRSYERFGAPEEIGQAMEELAYYREIRRQAEAEQHAPPTEEVDPEKHRKLAEANKALYEVEPKLRDAIAGGDFARAHEQRCRLIATDATADLMREADIEVSKESVMRYGKQLAPYFDAQENPGLHALFFVNPEQAIQKAWKRWKADIAKTIPKEKEPDKDHSPRLPRAPTPGGGSPPSGKPSSEPPASDRDFERHVTAKIKAMQGGR